MSLLDRIRGAYSTLRNPETSRKYVDPPVHYESMMPLISLDSPTKILSPMALRLTQDVMLSELRHVSLDSDGNFSSIKKPSELDERFNAMANMDQTGPDLLREFVFTILMRGHAVLVPTHTSSNPDSGSYDVLSMRVGTVESWNTKTVTVNVYDEERRMRRDVPLDKRILAIVQNPLYPIMNQQNSILSRLTGKLMVLDAEDRDALNTSLDLILQLPFAVKTDIKEIEAEARISSLVRQLNNSKYGVAYIDATEKITPLNRPLKNSVMDQVLALTIMLYNQLGISKNVLEGTASEAELTSYYARSIYPIREAIAVRVKNTFLTRTARTQGQDVRFVDLNLFKMAPISVIGTVSETLTRNAIVTPNEIRSWLNLRKSDDPDSDTLKNRNLNESSADAQGTIADE